MMDGYAIRVAARTARQDVMVAGMEADPAVRLQYANKYASSANGWKKWQGEALAFDKLNIIGREKEKEARFMQWVNADPARVQKYGNALKDIDEVESGAKTPSEEVTLLTESVYTIGPISVLSRFVQSYSRDIQAGKDPAESVNRAIEAAAGEEDGGPHAGFLPGERQAGELPE